MQLFHRGWDQHGQPAPRPPRAMPGHRSAVGRAVRRSQAAGAARRHARRLGRRVRPHDLLAGQAFGDNYGRDHHGALLYNVDGRRWSQTGFEYGRTDTHSYNIVEDPVHIRDLNATILHSLGIDHNRLTFKYQGLDQRLTGVEPCRVVDEILG